MENDLFAEAYAKEVGSVVETTIRCLTIVLRGSKFYLVLGRVPFFHIPKVYQLITYLLLILFKW